MLLRPAVKKDLPNLLTIFEEWILDEPEIHSQLKKAVSSPYDDSLRCRLIEDENALRAATLWIRPAKDRVRLLALGIGAGGKELGADRLLLKEEVIEWSNNGIAKAKTRLPSSLGDSHIDCLRDCGFISEGVVSRMNFRPRIRMCKHLLYGAVNYKDASDLLMRFFTAMGYETVKEDNGFRYRVRNEMRRPYIFSSWHKMTLSGPEIIVSPPARVLCWHELENLFYPLRVKGFRERPIVAAIDCKLSEHTGELPAEPTDKKQRGLFPIDGYWRPKAMPGGDLIFTYPSGLSGLRKGLPMLFYVNRLGAVATARIDEWMVDSPDAIYEKIMDMSRFDPEDVRSQVAKSGKNKGKALVIRYRWYKPFKRVVPLSEIKRFDDKFNPHRSRVLSADLFSKIERAGNDGD
jgi:hypothetical protein